MDQIAQLDLLRELVKEALTVQPGATRDEIITYVEANERMPHMAGNPKRIVGQMLSKLADKGVTEDRNGHWYLCGKPSPVTVAPLSAHPNGNGGSQAVASENGRAEIAPFYKQREGRVVTLERTPVEIDRVHRIEVRMGDRWVPIPTFGDVRVCIGPDIPRWTPDQEVMRGVTQIRITHTDERQSVYHVAADGCPVTFAPYKV